MTHLQGVGKTYINRADKPAGGIDQADAVIGPEAQFISFDCASRRHTLNHCQRRGAIRGTRVDSHAVLVSASAKFSADGARDAAAGRPEPPPGGNIISSTLDTGTT